MTKDLGEIDKLKVSLDTLRIWIEALNNTYQAAQRRLIDLKLRKTTE